MTSRRPTICTASRDRDAAAGKHVMVEKPLATTVADGLAMVAAAAQAERHLMVDFHARWHPLFMGAKSYVDRGDLGAPVMAYARLSDTIYVPTEMLQWSGHSGPEWFLFPHTMDVVRWLFGRDPVEVTAKGYRGVLEARGINCWDAIQAIVEFEAAPSARSRRRGSCPTATATSWTIGCRSTGRRAASRSGTSRRLGLHRPVSHAVLVGVGDAIWQGLGLPVRADPLLRGLRRRRGHAGGERRRRPRRNRDDRGDVAIAR